MSATTRGDLVDVPVREPAWPGSLVVVGALALPPVLPALAITLVILGTHWWQRLHGLPIDLPRRTVILAMALSFYAIGTWISVAIAWRWSSRRGVVAEVFAFRKLTWLDAAIAVVGFIVTFYASPLIYHWVFVLLGGHGLGRGANLSQPVLAVSFVFSTLLTAPVGEEILFRGLLVTWLRRLGWPIWAIWLIGSLAFGAIHWRYFGLAWSVQAVCFGAMQFGIRFWRQTLTPCWLIHLLFNARYTVLVPVFGMVVNAVSQ